YRSYTGEAADFERIAENILEDHYYAKDFEINGEAYYYVTISGEDIQSNTVKADGLLDSDGDELTDTMEYLIGTDPFNPDTDGDGLTDYEEIYLTFTDPLIYDTNGSGISDGEEDFDGDGLNNIQELLYGTDPYNDDTDEDGLTDYDEIFVYYTDPLSTDTDADGLSDILEIEYDMDPNNPDTLNDGILDGDRIFTVTKYSKHSNEDDSVKPKLEIELEGKQIESLTITKVDEKDIFLNDKIPGYLGNAFDFEVEGEFSSATLTYEFDQQLLNDPNFIPAIYYWDETEQFLFEIPDQTIEGNTVSAPVSHFSSYMVIAKNSYDEELFRFEVLPPTDEEMQSVNYDLALVLDKSSSISRRNYDLMKNLTGNLVQSLDDEDRISVFTFDSVVRRHSGFETKDVVTSIISGLPNPSGLTAIYSAIDMANQEFVTHSSDDATKVMIVLTDGFDNRSAVSSSSVAQTAIDNDIVIYTVGVGSVNVNDLTNIAESTGGAYYSASNFSDLEGIFDKLQVDIDLYRDSDSDGISDYHEKKIAAGELKLGTGAPMMHFDKLNHLNPDSDGDGLLDGQEMKIKSQTVQGKEVFYSYLYSNPSMEDSDSDGLLDNEDPTPLIEHDHRFERIFDPNFRPVNSDIASLQANSDHVYNTEKAGFNDYWIHGKTSATITGGYIASMRQSASALSHFLKNTGDLYTIDAKKLINQSSNAEDHLYKNLNDMLSASEAMVMDG
ncbi:MAG: VWA domain-containing protein, partial [Amphibacillus sp.]|nr:VWA domain-containing protein [Amphibacillus sp.]